VSDGGRQATPTVFIWCLLLTVVRLLSFTPGLKPTSFTNSTPHSFTSSFRTPFTDYCPDSFFWATRFLFLVFPYFFVSVPRAGLSWQPRQLLSARKYTVPYSIVRCCKLKLRAMKLRFKCFAGLRCGWSHNKLYLYSLVKIVSPTTWIHRLCFYVVTWTAQLYCVARYCDRPNCKGAMNWIRVKRTWIQTVIISVVPRGSLLVRYMTLWIDFIDNEQWCLRRFLVFCN